MSDTHDNTSRRWPRPLAAGDGSESGGRSGAFAPTSARVLWVDPRGAWPGALESLTGVGLRVAVAAGVDDAEHLALRDEHDAVVFVLSDDAESALAACARLRDARCPSPVLLACADADAELGVRAMRAGVVDLLPVGLAKAELASRVNAAADRARAQRNERRRVERLQRLCRRLARERADRRAYDAIRAQASADDTIPFAGPASEYARAIAADLDVESLLRTTLEFVLTQTGPTNAAVFLPTSAGEFSLGAYVNANLPKDTAEVVLDHLADVLPQRFREAEGLTHLDGQAAFEEALGPDAAWLSGSVAIITPCVADGDCLAVLALFRDRLSPFDAAVEPTIEAVRDRFAAQLAKVVRVHNRAAEQTEWLGFDVGETDEDDEAGEWGADWGKAA